MKISIVIVESRKKRTNPKVQQSQARPVGYKVEKVHKSYTKNGPILHYIGLK